MDSKVDKVTSTDNAIPKFNGTTGQVQNSGVIIDDNDFITTQIFNQDGTEFIGVEYFDAGLLGVPDATFSSTGARIYPDGTIRGKSSYGEYVKYPDGIIVMSKSIEEFTNFTINGSIYTYGLLSKPYPCSVASIIFSSCSIEEAPRWAGIGGSSLTEWVTPYLFSATATNFTATIKLLAMGEWK